MNVPRSLVIVLLSGLAAMTALGTAAQDNAPPASGEAGPSGQHPVGWRGNGSGRYPSAQPAAKWSAKENILWKTEVGAGSSSPIIVGERLFITAEPDLLICLDADSGRELWRKAHKTSDFPAALNSRTPVRPSEHGNATPTPVSDGKHVWAFFGTGIVACHDLNGQCRWANWFDLRQTTQYGRTTSPLLIGDRLLVHFGPLVCLNAATGELLWKNDRATAAYGTPARVRIGDVDAVITPGGDMVRVTDGAILASDLGRCAYASPVVDGGVVYFIDASISAVRLPQNAGDRIEGRELWYEDLGGEIYASPIVHDGRVYIVDRAANFHVIDAATGKSIFRKTLDLPPAGRNESPNVYPSLCLAGNRLFVGNDAGETVIVEPGDQGVAAGSCSLPAGSGATPVFSGHRMFARGGKLLYCIGQPPGAPGR